MRIVIYQSSYAVLISVVVTRAVANLWAEDLVLNDRGAWYPRCRSLNKEIETLKLIQGFHSRDIKKGDRPRYRIAGGT